MYFDRNINGNKYEILRAINESCVTSAVLVVHWTLKMCHFSKEVSETICNFIFKRFSRSQVSKCAAIYKVYSGKLLIAFVILNYI